jgi:hypothetical protein
VLKALESARNANPDSAGLRFLLGYHYGFLGYPQQAVKELDRGIQLQPQDPFIALLRNDMAAKIGVTPVSVPAPPQPPAQTPGGGPEPSQTQTPGQIPVNAPIQTAS